LRENAVIAFADDGESLLLLHPLIKLSVSVRMINNDTKIPLAFMIVSFPHYSYCKLNGIFSRCFIFFKKERI
jgi:hypothetical protein